MSRHEPLILASRSPRRADILRSLGIPFEVRHSGFDERQIVEEDHRAFVRATAKAKLDTVMRSCDHARWVLAADTMVFLDDRRLGQPVDDPSAVAMLGALQGRAHDVMTAVALGRAPTDLVAEVVVTSRVWFRAISEGERRRYVATGEGRDKAGSYAIQGRAAAFVERLEGSYTNVVGLPAAQVVTLLREHGALGAWP